MIQTDKYKKEIIGLLKKAGQKNERLGDYKCHYLTREAQFFVLLTNGQVEIDLDVVKNFAQKNNTAITYTLNKISYTYSEKSDVYKRKRKAFYKWNSLFSQRKST